MAAKAPRNVLRPTTLRLRHAQLQGAAAVLARHLGDVRKVKDLGVLVTPANARAILNTYLQATPDGAATSYIRGLALTLVCVANDRVKLSDEDLRQLKEFKSKLGKQPVGLTAKNRRVVGQISDPAVLTRLVNLPAKLRQQVNTKRMSLARRLQQMQVALAIELLLTAPMRMQNLATLCLDRQLQWPSGRHGSVYISLDPRETKNRQPLEYPIEGQTRDALHDYLDRFRVLACPNDEGFLFIHLDGTPVPTTALRDGITKATRRELGFAITPHQFRHIAAAITLDAMPGAIGLVKDLLGHDNLKTTQNFYAGMRTVPAGRFYAKMIDAKRGKTGPS